MIRVGDESAMNFAAHVTIFKGLLTRFQTLALITTSENSFKANFGECPEDELRRIPLLETV
jgi:hypothetical protein